MLEDGSLYAGTARGAFKETACEIIFNTSMTGYVELLTDPSYIGQGVVMTYPMIGNYGVNKEDFESEKMHLSALIVRELCDTPSNFRSTQTVDSLMKEYNIPCLSGVDTRAIVKKLRENGTMLGVLTTDISDKDRLTALMKAYTQDKLAESVCVKEKTVLGENNNGAKIAVWDFGVKRSIVNALLARGCAVTQYPAGTPADEIIKSAPDGVLLAGGLGNPADCADKLQEIKKLYDCGLPTFAVGLGHQLMAMSLGGEVERMKCGHYGANQPVKFLQEDRTYITAQSHEYVVTGKGLPSNAQVSCVNVNDKTAEGIVYSGKPIFSVQFTPKTGTGETAFLFDEFIKMAAEGKNDD